MNSDATEAALGLLGLSPLNAPQSHPQPQPHLHHHVAHPHGPSLTSTSVGIAIDRTSAPPIIQSALPPSLVPLKRKQPSPALPAATATPFPPSTSRDGLSTKPRQSSHPLATSSTPPIRSNRPLSNVSTKSSTAPSQRHPQQRPFSPIHSSSVPPQTPPTSQLPLASPSTSQHTLALSDAPPPPDSDAISCICGLTYDDGFSIACDDCSRWCHAACFGIVQGGEVPEFWKCWVCDPALVVDKERAVKTQKGRLRGTKASHGTNGGAPGATTPNGIGGNSAVDEGSGGVGKPPSRRKTSPGAERKSRRGSAVAAAIEGSGPSKKKRRASMLSPADPSSPSIPPSNHTSAQPHPGSSRMSHPNGNSPAAPSSLPPTPVTFPPDIYPNPSVYAQLLRVAKAWRGVTALNPPSPFIHPPPKTYIDSGYMRADSQGYRDRYGYSMSPLDNTTPVILDGNAGDIFVPRTVLRTDPPMSCFNLHSGLHPQYPPASTTCTPAHLRPPSPRLGVASDPSPFSHTSIYPSPPISNYMSPPVPSSSHPRSYARSPLTPSTNTISSSNPNDTIPATTLLAPYTAAIVPSAAYLADPLNGYAHLGMGKPQVRLIGGGWEVGLDARGIGGVPDPPDSGEKADGVAAGKEDVGDGKARWARCGCWPNAVVRPVVCGGTKGRQSNKGRGMRHTAECAKAASDVSTASKEGDPPRTVNGRSIPPPTSRMQGQQTDDSSEQDDAPSASDSDADPTSLSFALFALRDLRADEEIVLGWEWDDGHAVHMLPALMECPGMFAPGYLHHLRAQFTSILHALSSTFTTCACGSSTRDCAVRVMERVVEGRWPWPGGETTSEGSEGDSSDVNGASEEWDDGEGEVDVEGDGHLDPRPSRNWGLGMNVDVDIEMDASIEVDRRTPRVKKRKVWKRSRMEDATHVDGGKDATTAAPAAPASTLKPMAKKTIDLGPLVGVKRGFRTREKVPMNGGWGGVEIVPSSPKAFPEVRVEADPHVAGKGKEKARVAGDNDNLDIDPSPSTLPPRMRKPWSRTPAGQPEPLQQEDPPQDHSKHAGFWRVHERWRSPPNTNAESPISVSGAVEGGSGRGVGPEQGPVSVNGDGEDGADGQETEFDTETEVDGSEDTRQMPPPPMPASLDPTTVSSLAHAHAARSLSPRGCIQWDKNGVSATCIPPQTPTLISASSGRSSQPPSQGTHTATSAPPDSIIARSPVPSQVNNGTLSSSTSFPLATQAQVQSHPPAPVQFHPPPLIPSVSPSATFSKLSLHSPDASSSTHFSVLFSPSESTSLSSASASMQRSSDHRASSPPHRPSKPLHLHPQNELPSLPAPLSAPAVTLNSSDGMRDTPAEAQYQQPYRSSPESRHESHSPSDVEKRRPTNGEACRVRFASPEVSCGLPRLRGRTTSDSSEPLDADGGVSANTDTIGIVNEPEVFPLDRDAMDVDVDVVGDNQREDGIGSSRAASPDSRMNQVPEDEYSSPHMPSSPYPPTPLNSLPHKIPDVTDGAAPEHDSSPLAFDVNETTSQAEGMTVEPESAQPAREPSPPPPPKVKMSLKDFALRKKKQREEEMAAKAFRSPMTPDDPGLPSSPSPSVDIKRELVSEHAGIVQTADSDNIVNGPYDATKEIALDSFGTAHVSANGLDGRTGHEHRVVRGSSRTEEEKVTAEDNTLSAETQVPSMIEEAKAPDTMQSPPQAVRVLDDRDQTQKKIDSRPTTLTAKMEIIDAMVPSGLVGPDDRSPGVVSFAPEPPPPPLTSKQTSETTTADRASVGSIPRSVPPSTPGSTSTPASMSTSTSTSVVNSRSNSVGSPPNPNAPPHPHVLTSSSSIPSSRRPSHEDGEITSSTPPKAYLPRSHTPPTQPRSFHAVHPSSPGFGLTSSTTVPVPRRAAPPLSRSPLSNAAGPAPTPISSRPLPSGPRALRGSTTQSTHPPPYASTRPPYAGSQYIPRGPSADRDRIDWERGDRQWAAQARSRGRAGSNGWGR